MENGGNKGKCQYDASYDPNNVSMDFDQKFSICAKILVKSHAKMGPNVRYVPYVCKELTIKQL